MSLKTPESSLPNSHVLERCKPLRSTFSHILRAVFLKILGITSAITQIWALTWNCVILVSWPHERPSVTLGLQVSDGSFRNRVWSLRKHQRKSCQVKQNRALCLSNLFVFQKHLNLLLYEPAIISAVVMTVGTGQRSAAGRRWTLGV